MTEVLGERLQVAGWALGGTLPPEELARVLEQTVLRMGMDTGGMAPVIRQYPLPTGKGGVGHTIYLPFAEAHTRLGWFVRLRLWLAKIVLGHQRFAGLVFQPLTESFIVADDYPELNKTYVLAASCKPFTAGMVGRYLACHIGPVISVGEIGL